MPEITPNLCVKRDSKTANWIKFLNEAATSNQGPEAAVIAIHNHLPVPFTV